MEINLKRRKRECSLQHLIRSHPYLLDARLLNVRRGRTESPIPAGRLDIDFELPEGLVVVECKTTPLVDEDTRQLGRYLDDLQARSIPVCKAYLVGHVPSSDLDSQLLNHPPGIRLKYLFRDIPAHLAFCAGRHYFDAFVEVCPYCSESRIPGQELSLQF